MIYTTFNVWLKSRVRVQVKVSVSHPLKIVQVNHFTGLVILSQCSFHERV